MSTVTDYQRDLCQLFNGSITPREVVGTGYRYPKQVASQWLRKQMHNIENPNAKIDELIVQTNGKPFASETKAMQSTTYQQLINGQFKLISDGAFVADYGVMPAPGVEVTTGYCIYIVIAYRHKKSA
tara:strand:- start:1397 stop:1777 length:381 start_codon:yes stop_codon:yes gene_type:complete